MLEPIRFLETLALVLCAAAVATVLFQRIRQPLVLGYLLAGMAVGPYIPIPFLADSNIVHTLSELGVILLMFSLGIEFSLQKLLKVGPTAVFVGVVQCSLMIWLGFLLGQAFGWSWLASLYAGAVISISSTTIIVKAFDEQGIRAPFTQIVFGVLIVEDLIAILLISTLTALSGGQDLHAVELALSAGRLALFLILLYAIGLFVVPRFMRAVVALERPETTVVSSVGIAFGIAYLAAAFGYSVALGAFLAGSLIGESGVEKTVERLVQPVRDVFAAIFFVSVGMLINPADIAAHWPMVVAFLSVVVVGKVGSVTLSALLTGRSLQTSVKCGMSLAQIGEFSFIIAGVGIATEATDGLLYSIAVAVSGITTLLTPWLIRSAEPTAAFLDARLPRALQTFLALYGSWLEQLRTASTKDGPPSQIGRRVRWLLVDAMVVGTIVIAIAAESSRLLDLTAARLNLSRDAARICLILAAAIVSAPFWIGMIRTAKALGFELAVRAFPSVTPGAVDLADAPRRLLVVTLQLAIVFAVGLVLVTVTQPFLPPLWGAIVLMLLLGVLAASFWRDATNFQGHTRAAAQVILESLARQSKKGRELEAAGALPDVDRVLQGLGSPNAFQVTEDNRYVGQTLAEINLRGITGATVLAIQRGADSIAIPSGSEQIMAGDTLAIAGTHEAIEAAKTMLADPPVRVHA